MGIERFETGGPPLNPSSKPIPIIPIFFIPGADLKGCEGYPLPFCTNYYGLRFQTHEALLSAEPNGTSQVG